MEKFWFSFAKQFLVVGDAKPLKKIDQAKELKVKIITEAEWNKILNTEQASFKSNISLLFMESFKFMKTFYDNHLSNFSHFHSIDLGLLDFYQLAPLLVFKNFLFFIFLA